MGIASAYTLDSFVADIRQVFVATQDPCAQAQRVAEHMQRLLTQPGCLDDRVHLAAETGFGRVNLHLDDTYGHPGPGFLVMCALLPPSPQAQRSLTHGTPHDHGASWVVYGVYQGAIEQTRFRWSYPDGQWTSPALPADERFVQHEGEVAFFLPGEIYKTATVSDGPALVLRVEGQAMERVIRHRYDQDANTAEMFQAAGR
jgi:predicted metal-dependent enzyme (double-stranded beta helix superfamily)